jgi:hypothetical protein
LFALTPTTSRLLAPVPALKLESVNRNGDADTAPEVVWTPFSKTPVAVLVVVVVLVVGTVVVVVVEVVVVVLGVVVVEVVAVGVVVVVLEV